jgi:hypothetical protein
MEGRGETSDLCRLDAGTSGRQQYDTASRFDAGRKN